MNSISLSKVAQLLSLSLKGEDKEVTGVNTLELAGPCDVSFLANPKYIDKLENTKAGAVIIAPEHADKVECALVSENPYLDFGRILHVFAKKQGSFEGISELAHICDEVELGQSVTIYPFAYIGPNVKIGNNVTIFPNVYIGENCQIGDNSILYPNCVLMSDTVLGDKCIIHAGVVLGADGFGFIRDNDIVNKIPQIGKVIIGNSVEVGANTTIDRAVLDSTKIKNHTKIDNLVQVGHNVEIGECSLIVSQVGISGSTIIGKNATFAGQAGIAGHLKIGDNVTIAPKSGVAKDIADNATVGGAPAVDQMTFMKTLTLMPKFPELFKRISKLEKELAKLQENNNK